MIPLIWRKIVTMKERMRAMDSMMPSPPPAAGWETPVVETSAARPHTFVKTKGMKPLQTGNAILQTWSKSYTLQFSALFEHSSSPP